MRKQSFCMCKNKDADYCEADQRLCFCYMGSTVPLHVLSISKISGLQPSCVLVQLYKKWSYGGVHFTGMFS